MGNANDSRRITQLMLETARGTIPIQVIRSNRRSIGLEVHRDGIILARIPSVVSDRELQNFIREHQAWIVRKYNALARAEDAGKSTGAKAYDQLTEQERQQICDKLAQRVRQYCRIMGVTVGRITIRNQKTRWGSCSSKGNVNLNYHLYYLPEELLDYVVIHELAHRRYMNHSAQFWAEVERYCPDYKMRREKLREYRLG